MTRVRFVLWAGMDRPHETITIHPDGVTPNLVAISPPIPLALAHKLRDGLQAVAMKRRRNPTIHSLRRTARRLIGYWLGDDEATYSRSFFRRRHMDGGRKVGSVSTSENNTAHLSVLKSSEDDVTYHTLEILSGRALMTGEIERALSERGVTSTMPLDQSLDRYVHQHIVSRMPGVWGHFRHEKSFVAEWQWACTRCGSEQIRLVPCPFCHSQICPTCVSCESLGRSTGCVPLYHRPLERPSIHFVDGSRSIKQTKDSRNKDDFKETVERKVEVRLSFDLSSHQTKVSEDLLNSRDDALIHAACGAGKTETVLGVMQYVLSKGGKALFAVPRRDVALQLGERLSQVLIGVDVVTLTGDTPHKYADAPLIVSTVHQAIRFRKAFDLVIIDEIDAFPLNKEPWLLGAIEQAKRPDGRVVMMTATPPDRLVRRMQIGDVTAHTLPGRPHGHPLPVPEMIFDGAYAKQHVVPYVKTDKKSQYPKWIQRLGQVVEKSVTADRRLIIFVPSVELTRIVAHAIDAFTDETGINLRVRSVDARDANRTDKIAALAGGNLDCLVSTSILERGVTLPFLDVIVFLADWEGLFDAAALIQMAGRVGRSFEDPTGSVRFLASRKTPAMIDAVNAIIQLNSFNTPKRP